MKTISADYNAMTEAGHVCLTTRGSQEDILQAGSPPGRLGLAQRYAKSWSARNWPSTIATGWSESRTGTRSCIWMTKAPTTVNRIGAELNLLLNKEPPSSEDEPRILELLTQLDHASQPHFHGASPEPLAFRRALALRQMGKLGLALVEMEDARRARPDDPMLAFVYLDILRLEDLPSAVLQAQEFAELPDVPALVLSACINILATWAEHASDDQFDLIAQRVLTWCRRFDQAQDLDEAGPSLVALSYFNRGLVLLRAGRITLARQAFENAQQHYPVGSVLDEVTGLQTYDRHARTVVERVRTIIAEQFPLRPVAA